ncbi:hypothetical protein N865_11480 [Intrasporangium oryzae NRRL B-24470]|uniref:Uncharacterized protein n=1 Tax=Intrasporangium oryzae NRRL B-24470 TaxID=1386089 RepID=W9GBB2_9MICO|nr:hypothetical protein [Intrasporangium oryzae]EWT01154.1 hypothetical protein N865_11480 [Intrasporangium oryzae NRRL B-24470]
MARIVELTYPGNVTLVRGAMQNWRDFDLARPSGSDVVRRFVLEQLPEAPARVLVVGPMSVSLVREVAERSGHVTVLARAIPDAAEIGTAVPTAQVLCGSLDELDGEFDVVLAIDDLSTVQSLERPTAPWSELAALVLSRLAPEGQALLGVENERGLHRPSGADDPYVRNADADWTPFATWDATRPRSRAQLEAWLPLGRASAVHDVVGTWSAPTALAHGPCTSGLATLWTGRSPVTPVLGLRSAALAGCASEHFAGWLVSVGGATQSGDWFLTPDARWVVDAGVAEAEDGRRFTIPPHGLSPFVVLVEAAADTDTPALRSLLRRWAAWLRSVTVDGMVPAAYADARLTNLVPDGDGFLPLVAGSADASFESVAWGALGSALDIITNQGLRHPWPTAMHRETRLAALGAMAGLAAPDDLGPYTPQVRDAGQTRDELLAVVRRQQEELRSTWSRFRWDEKQYAAWKAVNLGKRAVRYARKHGRSMPKDAAKRVRSTVAKRQG